MRIPKFQSIRRTAERRKGGAAELKKLLPKKPLTRTKLAKLSDDRILSELTKGVFRAGFSWKVIEKKWPDFEDVFRGFDPKKIARFSPKKILSLADEPRIVRHRGKIEATIHNAHWALDMAKTHGSLSKFIADWPIDQIVELYAELGRAGSRLGGMTGPYALRGIGKDGFLLTRSVVAALKAFTPVSSVTASKKSRTKVQQLFNQWHNETGLPMAHLSRILACSVPD